MYLHLGNEKLVSTEDIVGIFDMDNTTVSKWTRKFLNISEKKHKIENISEDIPKTFIVVSVRKSRKAGKRAAEKRLSEKEKETVILSQLAPSTLQKRTGLGYKQTVG